jgi:ABC-type transport system substrate-binding protein
MKMKITSVLIGILLLATAAFLLAQALSPNKGADLSASPSQPRSDDVVTSATETCDPQTIAKAVKGYTCVVKTKSGSVAWRVEAVLLTDSRTFRVMKDLKSGLYVSDDMGKHSHESAVKENLCQSPDYSNQRGNLTSVSWRLPSGYPRSLNGKNGFPNHDSDFVVLEDDGVRQVIPGISSKYFVSSSEAGKTADYISYGFDGEFGGIDAGCNGNGMASLRCVAQ